MEGFSKMGPRAKRVLLAALNFLNGLGKVCLGDLRCGSGISLCTNDARQRDHDDTWWTPADLKEHYHHDLAWFKDKVLYVQKYKKELSIANKK